MANLYECVVIVDPDETDDGVDAVIGQLRGHIEAAGSEVLFVDRWGRRKLAYPIQRKTEGVYTLIYVDGPPDLPRLLRARIRIMESILREMVIRLEDEQEAAIRERAKEMGDEDARLAKTQLAAAEERARAKVAAAAGEPSDGDRTADAGADDETEAGAEGDVQAEADEPAGDESAPDDETEAGAESDVPAEADEPAGDESAPDDETEAGAEGDVPAEADEPAGDEDAAERSADHGEEA